MTNDGVTIRNLVDQFVERLSVLVTSERNERARALVQGALAGAGADAPNRRRPATAKATSS
jgi:hypothetical protein